jgi:hypothetical protein
MSRFRETSDTIYVGYNINDLKIYADFASKCKNIPKVSEIYKEFNPSIVPYLNINDEITPSQPFFGAGKLSLRLTDQGNLYLQNSDKSTLWTASTQTVNGAVQFSGFTLDASYTDISGNIYYTGASGQPAVNTVPINMVYDPYCELDSSANFVCYDNSFSTPTPYLSFKNGNNKHYDQLKLMINGDYTLPNGIGALQPSGKTMLGNITILDTSNNIVKTSMNDNDYNDLSQNLQSIFDTNAVCLNGPYAGPYANTLISEHNTHLASEQLLTDSKVAYNLQYINTINLGVGILLTFGYVYYLYKKK